MLYRRHTGKSILQERKLFFVSKQDINRHLKKPITSYFNSEDKTGANIRVRV